MKGCDNMKKLSIVSKTIEAEIVFENLKYIIGENKEKLYCLCDLIRKALNFEANSEYAVESGIMVKALLNDLDASQKNTSFYVLNNSYNLENELKIGPKTLLLKYFESILDEIEYSDELNTLKIILEGIHEGIEEQIKQFCDGKLSIKTTDIGVKEILKLAIIEMKKDEYIANWNDLTEFEKIKFQVDIIARIALNSKAENSILFVEVNFLTRKIDKYLNSINVNGLSIIVVPHFFEEIYDYQKVFFVGNRFVDFANENLIYHEFVMNMPNVVELNEMCEEFLRYINGQKNIRKDIIDVILD